MSEMVESQSKQADEEELLELTRTSGESDKSSINNKDKEYRIDGIHSVLQNLQWHPYKI